MGTGFNRTSVRVPERAWFSWVAQLPSVFHGERCFLEIDSESLLTT